MYNDEKNLYHYTYRRDVSETGQEPTLGQQLHSSQGGRPVQEMKPVKKSRLGLKITALALACALMGGAAGSGAVFWAMDRAGGAGQDASQSAGQSQVLNQGGQISAPPVTVKNADGVTPMTDAEVYAANVNSVVAITTSGTAGNGYWSQPTSGAGSGLCSGVLSSSDFLFSASLSVRPRSASRYCRYTTSFSMKQVFC